MKNLLRIEDAALFLFSVYMFSMLDYSWWLFPVLFLLPDLGMLGYAVNNKAGAMIYNIVHHRALSLAIYVLGAFMKSPITQLIGIILFAHSSLDRVFDYGFKYSDHFKHTHLSNSSAKTT